MFIDDAASRAFGTARCFPVITSDFAARYVSTCRSTNLSVIMQILNYINIHTDVPLYIYYHNFIILGVALAEPCIGLFNMLNIEIT